MDSTDINSNFFRVNLFNGVCIAYVDCTTDVSREMVPKGTIILLHGFPQTSYQYRKVIPILTNAGYRVIAPDYRGAGESSKPNHGFSKAIMAGDIIALLDVFDIDEPVHVVGHDIGAVIAFYLSARWSERVASVCLSECLLPGSSVYSAQLAENPVKYFHFILHSVDNLPEALIKGREQLYVEYFINRHSYRIGAFPPELVQRYTDAYSQPGALRCALELFRVLPQDAKDTREWLAQYGKCKASSVILCGEHSGYREYAEKMAEEVIEKSCITTAIIRGAGHFLAEENPYEFSETLLASFQRQSSLGLRSV